MQVDSQRLAERRSLALHRRVADRLLANPALVATARERVTSWLSAGSPSAFYLSRWDELLRGPLADLIAAMLDDSEAGRELRGASPFAGVVPPRERWRIWKAALDEPSGAEAARREHIRQTIMRQP